MQHAEFEEWIDRYERTWRTAGTDTLSELFTADATYLASPWSEPLRGLPAIEAFWDAERDGHDEHFTMSYSVLACDAQLGVARVEVHYERGSRWRDIWIIRLDDDRRCTSFEEWPFAPDQSDGHQQGR